MIQIPLKRRRPSPTPSPPHMTGAPANSSPPLPLSLSLRNYRDNLSHSYPSTTASFAATSDLRGHSTTIKREAPLPSSSANPTPSTTLGIPRSATLTTSNAPVHVDVGGTLYTSSLETLIKFPESRLGKMFNGTIPIVLDSMKNHYFIDRDGRLFRYILNFCRTTQLLLPDNFEELDILYQEACYYEISPLVAAIQHQMRLSGRAIPASAPIPNTLTTRSCEFECVTVHISPDIAGERVAISAQKCLLEEVFPEMATALTDGRNAGWTSGQGFVIRFPINGFCKLNSLQVIQRLLETNFTITASSGGGVEGQTFTEYLLSRKTLLPLTQRMDAAREDN